MEEEEGVSKTEVSNAPHNIRVLHKNGSNIIHQNTLHTWGFNILMLFLQVGHHSPSYYLQHFNTEDEDSKYEIF